MTGHRENRWMCSGGVFKRWWWNSAKELAEALQIFFQIQSNHRLTPLPKTLKTQPKPETSRVWGHNALNQMILWDQALSFRLTILTILANWNMQSLTEDKYFKAIYWREVVQESINCRNKLYFIDQKIFKTTSKKQTSKTLKPVTKNPKLPIHEFDSVCCKTFKLLGR